MPLEFSLPAHLSVSHVVDLIAASVWETTHEGAERPGRGEGAMDRLRSVIRTYLVRTLVEIRPLPGGSRVWVMHESAEVPDLFGINVAREIQRSLRGILGRGENTFHGLRALPGAINAAIAPFRHEQESGHHGT